MSKGNLSNHNEIAATAWRQRNADWWSEMCKDPHGPSIIDGATLKTGRSMHRKTLLLVRDMRDAVVVTSEVFLRKFLLALRKRFVVEGWILC
jgi:hypothetical protein